MYQTIHELHRKNVADSPQMKLNSRDLKQKLFKSYDNFISVLQETVDTDTDFKHNLEVFFWSNLLMHYFEWAMLQTSRTTQS